VILGFSAPNGRPMQQTDRVRSDSWGERDHEVVPQVTIGYSYGDSAALVRRNSVIEFRAIGAAGRQGPHASLMNRRTGSAGSTLRMEPANTWSISMEGPPDDRLNRLSSLMADVLHRSLPMPASGYLLHRNAFLAALFDRGIGFCTLSSRDAHGTTMPIRSLAGPAHPSPVAPVPGQTFVIE